MQWKEKWVGKSTTWWTSKTIKKKVVSLLWRNPSNLAIWSLSFHGQIMCINSFWNVYRVRKKNHTKVFYQNFIKHTGYDKKIYTKVFWQFFIKYTGYDKKYIPKSWVMAWMMRVAAPSPFSERAETLMVYTVLGVRSWSWYLFWVPGTTALFSCFR